MDKGKVQQKVLFVNQSSFAPSLQSYSHKWKIIDMLLGLEQVLKKRGQVIKYQNKPARVRPVMGTCKMHSLKIQNNKST